MNDIQTKFEDITRKFLRKKNLSTEDIKFLQELGSKVQSITFRVDGGGYYRHYLILNFPDGSEEEIYMHRPLAITIATTCFMGIDKIDKGSIDHVEVDYVCRLLLMYPKELVDFIDWCFRSYYEEIDVYKLIDKCTKAGYGETTMALLRYVHELTEHGEVDTTMMRL